MLYNYFATSSIFVKYELGLQIIFKNGSTSSTFILIWNFQDDITGVRCQAYRINSLCSYCYTVSPLFVNDLRLAILLLDWVNNVIDSTEHRNSIKYMLLWTACANIIRL